MIAIDVEITADIVDLVEQIEATLRAGTVSRAAQAAGDLVAADARPRVTAPGYRGDKAGLPALQNSIFAVTREYNPMVVAVVGATWPDGAHGHLVEFGHLQKLKDGSVMHVPPHPWLRPAAEATRSAQQSAVFQILVSAAPVAS